MKHLLPLISFLSLLLTATVLAQTPAPDEVVIKIGRPGDRAVPLALPTAKGGAAQSEEFWGVVKRDLELTGYFRIIPPEATTEPSGTGLRPGEFDFSDWRTVGAAILAKTGAQLSGSSLRTEVWVYDVAGTTALGSKAYMGSPSSTRSMGHRIANEIMYLVTKHHGFFDTRISFSGKFGANKEIYVMDIDGYGRRAITKNGSINLKPRWNPSGTALSFTSYLSGNPDLYVADLSKGQIRRVSSRSGLNTGGAFSPDGSRMIVTLTTSGDPELYLIDAASGNQIAQLTKSPGIDVSATWSPDGSQLAFVSDRGGSPQVYIMPAGGGEARRISFGGSQCTDPAWSPKGNKIAYVARDGNFDVFTVGLDGKGLTRITQGQGDNEDPSWSPDGDYLAFSSTRSGSEHIWIASEDGNYQTQITTGGGGYSNPSWSPHLDW